MEKLMNEENEWDHGLSTRVVKTAHFFLTGQLSGKGLVNRLTITYLICMHAWC